MVQCPGAGGAPSSEIAAPEGTGVCPECGRVVGLFANRRLYPHTAEAPAGRVAADGVRVYRRVHDRPLPQAPTRALKRIPAREGDDPALSALASLGSEEVLAAIERVLQTLSSREREVLKMRFLLGDGHTLEECARVFKVTRERIRQIEVKAIQKMQHPVRARHLVPFLPPTKPERFPPARREAREGRP